MLNIFITLGLGLMSARVDAQALLKKAWGMNEAPGVEAPQAWSYSKPKCETSGVVVAVIDTGVDVNHPALSSSMWINTKEKNGKPGVDDDGNGFVDDIYGWDFATNSGKISDEHGHGTHISGIISGNIDSGVNFKGVCPGVKIMSLRYYDKNASGLVNLQNTIKSIKYAVKMGVDIINYSGGGAEYSREEFEALQEAEKKGILVVAAAGNERSNADKRFYFPAAYPLKNILSVTAIDQSGRLLSLSNWGIQKVHVAAPGQSILSTLPKGVYGAMSGTSQATAYVSGIAALMLSEDRRLNFTKLISLIEGSSVKSHFLAKKTKTGSRVNALAAMKAVRGSVNIASSDSPSAMKGSQAAKSARARIVSSDDDKASFKGNKKKSLFWQKDQ